jgi:hypothetical protein
MRSEFRPARVVVLEINEVSWELMAPWLAAGDLPNFARLRAEGVWGRTWADEPGGPDGLLEPWVTWTTLYTGVPHTEHGVKFLEQPVETIRYRRLWDLAADGGKTVGVFASPGTWPPRRVDGFWVPGSFSPDNKTHPEDLKAIQDLNLRYTRSYAPGATAPGKLETLRRGMGLARLGLGPATAARVAKVLVEIKRHPDRDWKKVCLQPVVNLPFFETLHRKHRPDFATFHTNHVAHYQHRFMRAYQPDAYPDPTDPAETRRFGGAIRYGYLWADWLLGRFFRLADRDADTVLVVASSMGQQPYIPAKYEKVAPRTCRIKSIEALVAVLGLTGKCEYFSTMAPQWNLRIADPAVRKAVIGHLFAARYVPVNKSVYTAVEVDDTVVVTPVSHHGVDETCRCSFPTLPGAPVVPFGDLTVQADDTRKSGSHHPVGLLGFYGRRVRRGAEVGQVNNLDVAPTLLSLLGLPIPEYMTGRAFAGDVLTETRTPVPA